MRMRRPNDYNQSMAIILGASQPNPHFNCVNIGLIPKHVKKFICCLVVGIPNIVI
jgi:hypothetical protein